jgi:SHS2 domain-containing protein
MLLALVCSYPEARAEAVATGIENLFEDDYLAVARLITDTLAATDDVQALSRLSDTIETEEIRTLLSRLLVSDARMADIDWRTAFDSCLRSREKKAILPIREIIARLAVLDPNSPEHAALLKQAEALRTRKSKIQP